MTKKLFHFVETRNVKDPVEENLRLGLSTVMELDSFLQDNLFEKEVGLTEDLTKILTELTQPEQSGERQGGS